MDSKQPENNIFYATIFVVVAIFIFLKWIFPYLAQFLVASENPLPVPSALMSIFLLLTLASSGVYVSISDERLAQFKRPLIDFIQGTCKEQLPSRQLLAAFLILALILVAACILEGVSSELLVTLFVVLLSLATLTTGVPFRIARWSLFILFPIFAGGIVYSKTITQIKTPTALRIQHPTIPKEYENLENPFRQASEEQLRSYISEGRILFQKNCRPCHGTKADGEGPMARAFRLKPANFRDPGTIATLVESYAFWRIKKGAPGLPKEASPWDSAMPAWENDLTDDEIWKIIIAEYETAGVEPRKPEKLE